MYFCKPVLPSYLLAALLIFCMLLPVGAIAAPQAGQPAPEFKVVTTTGQIMSNDSFSNHVLVLDFFATWCIPCRKSIPHLVDMHRKYGKQGLQILGMSADDGEKAVNSFASWHHVSYPLAIAGETVQTAYAIRSVPVMYIIDKRGRVAAIYRGFSDETARNAERLIKKLLAES